MAGTSSISATQLALLPDEPLDFTHTLVCLHDLPCDDDLIGPRPDPALVASIRRVGVHQPVIVVATSDGALRVVEGKRRVKAARAAGLAAIPAWLTRADGPVPVALTLVAHATRRANPAADLDAIERLLGLGATERDIAQETGMRLPALRKRLQLLQLNHGLREGLRRGAVAAGVAEEAAKLPVAVQHRLAAKLADAGTLIAADVDAERRVRATSAVATFPFSVVAATPGVEALDAVAESTAKQSTCRGVCGTPLAIPASVAECTDVLAAGPRVALGGDAVVLRVAANRLVVGGVGATRYQVHVDQIVGGVTSELPMGSSSALEVETIGTLAAATVTTTPSPAPAQKTRRRVA